MLMTAFPVSIVAIFEREREREIFMKECCFLLDSGSVRVTSIFSYISFMFMYIDYL